LNNLSFSSKKEGVYETSIKGLLPSIEDWKKSIWPMIRGAVLGFFIGIMPGPSVTISTFVSYSMEKKLSRYPEKFGTGVIEGVAGPESANNAATSGAFIPLVSLGIPANITMALFMGALMIHGILPGPLFIKENPDIFWGFIVSMYIGNALLLVLNLPLIGLWVKVLKTPYEILSPIILLFCFIGVYTLNSNVVEMFIMLIFGILGYLSRRVNFEAAPFILAFVLGPMMERSLRESLLMSRGKLEIFITRPIPAVLLGLSLALFLYSIFSVHVKKIIRESQSND
jgi:putative tricarboxylic transport membrane protein